MSAPTAIEAGPGWFPTRFKPIAPLFMAVLGLLMLAGIAIAQDPPSRVGRLSDVAGGVFLASEDSEAGWQPVGINYPVTIGDNVWVTPDGRAEIDYGGGQLRLAQEANVHFAQLDERIFSAFLANGRAILRLRMLDQGEVAKLDTPNVRVDLLRPGIYRLDTSADATYTMLAVRDGEAEMYVGDRRLIVGAGQTVTVQGNGIGASVNVRDGIGTDGFDQYALDRDRRIESVGVADQYVSTYVPGVADLNAYGTWTTTPTYGAVWYPSSVSADWVPYQDGSWTYVQPWGWTWVDNAPWGWVPFHYGRWVRIGPRWAWTPGRYERRPVYAPALVAWYGGPSGTSWSVGAGRPTYGWVPLSWAEPYWPHYRHSNDYWRRQNQYVSVDVRRVSSRAPQRFNYANARIPGAVAAAPADVLANRRPVRNNSFTVTPQQASSAPLTSGPLSVRPATRPGMIDKMPARAPETAGSYAARVRPDLRGQSPGIGGRAQEPGSGQGSRPGFGGVPYGGSAGNAVAPTPATPLPSAAPSVQVGPGSVQPLPGTTPSSGGRPGIGNEPGAGGGGPAGGRGAGSRSQGTEPGAIGGQVYQPGGRAGTPQVGTPQVATPQAPTPQVATPQAPSIQPIPAQPQSVNPVAPQSPPPTVNRPGIPQSTAPQPAQVQPAQPQAQPMQPQAQPMQPMPPIRQRPEPGAMRSPPQIPQQGLPAPQPVLPQAAPSQPTPQPMPMPQQRFTPMQSAPSMPMPVPQQRVAPIQRTPAPAPAFPVAPSSIAPAGGSIAPAGGSIAPAPQSIAPAPNTIAAPQPRRGPPPQQGPQGARPGEPTTAQPQTQPAGR